MDYFDDILFFFKESTLQNGVPSCKIKMEKLNSWGVGGALQSFFFKAIFYLNLNSYLEL